MHSHTLDLTQIGVFGRTHGTEGEINVRLTIQNQDFFDLLSQEKKHFLFVNIDGLYVPYELENARDKHGEFILLKFRHIDTPENANLFVNRSLYIESDLLNENTEFLAEHFIGFTVLDEYENEVGIVEDVDDSTINILFKVLQSNCSYFLLPIAEELIKYVDVKERIISVILPEGITQV